MCLQTKWKNPRIAKKDIIVYKILTRDRKSCFGYNFKYEINKMYTTVMKKEDSFISFDTKASRWREEIGEDNLKSIGPGFHSSLRKERIVNRSNYYIYLAIIPKGAKYYKDGTGLIVSNKIKIKDELPDN